jgi:hypothetical protein
LVSCMASTLHPMGFVHADDRVVNIRFDPGPHK